MDMDIKKILMQWASKATAILLLLTCLNYFPDNEKNM